MLNNLCKLIVHRKIHRKLSVSQLYIELYEFAVAITAKDTFQWHQKDIDIELYRAMK
jgi:hypothetical protein